MNISLSNKKYGLVLPDLQGIIDPAEYSKTLEKNRVLINNVSAFLEKNGAERIACTGTVFLIDQINSRDSSEPLIGLTFFGTPELAQKLADAFPDQRIVSYDGETLPARGVPAVKASFAKKPGTKAPGVGL